MRRAIILVGRRISIAAVATAVFALASPSATMAATLSPQQETGLIRHGIWEWSLRNCEGAMRNYGYWYALVEVGEFRNATEIIELEDSDPFREGWDYMQDNASKFGMDKTCDYAMEQWPAVLYREEASNQEQ